MMIANKNKAVQVLLRSLKGNPVKIGDGPAAVIGNENRKHVTVSLWADGKTR